MVEKKSVVYLFVFTERFVGKVDRVVQFMDFRNFTLSKYDSKNCHLAKSLMKHHRTNHDFFGMNEKFTVLNLRTVPPYRVDIYHLAGCFKIFVNTKKCMYFKIFSIRSTLTSPLCSHWTQDVCDKLHEKSM
jgi:hypothetical protein